MGIRVESRNDHIMIQGHKSKPATHIKLEDLPELVVKINQAAKSQLERLQAEKQALEARLEDLQAAANAASAWERASMSELVMVSNAILGG